jgi:hypothetical protein
MKNKTAFFYAMILLFVSTGVFAQLGGDQKLNVNALANNRLISASNPNVVADVIPASVQTTPVKNITSNSAESGIILVHAEGIVMTAHGICLGSASGPTLKNCLKVYGVDKGRGPGFNVQLTGLRPNSMNYIKSYFTTKAGVTTYGNELRFRTVDGSK